MAITAQNASYIGQGPASSGQVLVTGPSDGRIFAYKGTATFTLDGTLTALVVNFIDGTQTLPFTPSAILISQNGGTQATSIAANVTAISATSFTITLASAGTSTDTVTFAFLAL